MTKIKVRLNTFETNSSSAHTMIITENKPYTTDEEIKEDLKLHTKLFKTKKNKIYLQINDNTFGTNFRILRTWVEKIKYLVASIGIEYENELISAIQRRVPNFIGFGFFYYSKESFLNDHIIKVSDNVCYYDTLYDDEDLFGEVDHQSADMGMNIINCLEKEDEYKNKTVVDIIYDIIFSNNFIIVTDSDNDSTFDTLLNGRFFDDTINNGKIYRERYIDKPDGGYSYIPEFIRIKDLKK